MSAVTRQRLALRIGLLLQRELGEGVDVRRMVAQELYARDVLLVCEALPGHELAELARQYRQACRADDTPAQSPAASPAPDSPAAPAGRRAGQPAASRSSSPPSATWSPTA